MKLTYKTNEIRINDGTITAVIKEINGGYDIVIMKEIKSENAIINLTIAKNTVYNTHHLVALSNTIELLLEEKENADATIGKKNSTAFSVYKGQNKHRLAIIVESDYEEPLIAVKFTMTTDELMTFSKMLNNLYENRNEEFEYERSDYMNELVKDMETNKSWYDSITSQDNMLRYDN